MEVGGTNLPDRQQLEAKIRAAFVGVVLGRGISLAQAEAIDRHGKDQEGRTISDKQYRDLARSETTDDWEKLTLTDLERDNIAHLDAEGLRYYLPALMLSVLESYDPLSMRVIGTLSALDPRPMSKYHIDRYSLLNGMQKHVIARYLQALPTLLHLDYEDAVGADRAIAAYWYEFIATPTLRSKR